MKYFKIYHQNCRVAKAYVELSESEYNAEISLYAELNAPEITDEDGNIDYEGIEIEMDGLAQFAEEEAKYSGLNQGDYHVYKREDGFDMYEIEMEAI